MRYQIPQFIEIEDKIFGPLTLKQFIYLAGGGALSYLVYALFNPYLPIFITVILMVPTAALGIALAFYKINNKPFIDVVESALKYYGSSKLYLWKKEPKKVTLQEEQTANNSLNIPKLADSKLKDLAWNLDISEKKM